MKLTGGQIVCESLLREGVDVVFGIPGGAILPLYQYMSSYPQIRHILTRHEEGASMAADGYARATGKVGVCMATSGPGATNLLTGIATAQMDSVPMVIITGQVARPGIGKDAFQEVDISGITLPVTKHNYLVMRAEDIATAIKEAFYIANTGRPGPVLVDIPRDVFTEEAEFVYPDSVDLPGYKPVLDSDPIQIRKAAQLINEAKKPLILAGHGVIISRAYDELVELAEKAQIPVITTLLGRSAFPDAHVLFVGMPGMHGLAYASLAIDEADLVIALGMRFDDRITGKVSGFAQNAKVIHVDIDPAEIDKNVRTDVPIVGDLAMALRQLNPSVEASTHPEWLRRIEELKAEHPSLHIRQTEKLLPQQVVRDLCDVTDGRALVVTGVGQHQMWAAQYYACKEPNSFITSGGLGSMGFEVPAAMGAQVGQPDRVVWSIAGDGGFQMTMSELATIVENNLPVKFAILNNGFLGMVRQWQQMFYNKDYFATHYTRNPDFVKLAEAFGIRGIRVTERSQSVDAIKEAMAHPGPVVVDFVVEEEENVYPMIPSGQTTAELMEEPLVEEARS
jgi:acetolactate synthase-1/2/3 large subunit